MPDLDDTSGQLKLEGWLYIVFIFYISFNEEVLHLPITVKRDYWYFEIGGTILLGKFGRRMVEISIYIQNYAGGWLEFHALLRAGRLD